jgi:hypothetical protein
MQCAAKRSHHDYEAACSTFYAYTHKLQSSPSVYITVQWIEVAVQITIS